MSRRESPVSVLSSPYSTQALYGTSNQSEEEYLTVSKNVLKSPFRTLSPTAPSPRTIKAPIDDEDESQEQEEISQYGSFLNVPWSPPQGVPKSLSKSPSKITRRPPLAQPLPTQAPSPEDVEHILSLRAKLKEEEIEKRVEDKVLQLAKRMEAIKIAAKQELQQLQQSTIKSQQQFNTQLIQEHDKHHNAINKVISDMTKKQEEEQQKGKEQVQRAKEIINLQKQKEQQEELDKRKKAEEQAKLEAERKQKEVDEKKRQEDLQKKLKEEATQKELDEKKKQQEQQMQKQAQSTLDNNQPISQPSLTASPSATPSNIPAHLKLAVSPNDPDCISTPALNQLISRMTKYYEVQEKLKTLEQDPSWPVAKKEYFKKINMAINTLSNSSSQILKKFEELAALLFQTKQQNALVYYYCINLISLKIMDQGSTQVSLHRDSCYSYAALVVALASKFPDFGELVLGHFHKACPYTLPYYPVKQPGQSDADFMEALGFKQKILLRATATGAPEFESEDAYNERMRGILAVYAAVTQTHFPNISNFHGISYGWTWFARILNMKPRKLTADVILTFLEVAGHKLLANYNRQFRKVLAVLKDEMQNALPKEATASNTRLQLYLNEYAKNMKIEIPKAATFSD